MTDCIERNDLRDALYEADAVTMKGVAIINTFPAADVKPVVYGRWIKITNDLASCSVCGDYISFAINCGYNYCPNCGADMEMINEENENET